MPSSPVTKTPDPKVHSPSSAPRSARRRCGCCPRRAAAAPSPRRAAHHPFEFKSKLSRSFRNFRKAHLGADVVRVLVGGVEDALVHAVVEGVEDGVERAREDAALGLGRVASHRVRLAGAGHLEMDIIRLS